MPFSTSFHTAFTSHISRYYTSTTFRNISKITTDIFICFDVVLFHFFPLVIWNIINLFNYWS